MYFIYISNKTTVSWSRGFCLHFKNQNHLVNMTSGLHILCICLFMALSDQISFAAADFTSVESINLQSNVEVGSTHLKTKLKPLVVNTWNIPRAAQAAWNALFTEGKSSVDAVVAGCSVCEDGSCGGSIGAGGSPDENEETTLDAMIMDGRTMDVGSVGCLRYVQSAIAVAHAVMKYTKHTLLVGELATDFAVTMGFTKHTLKTNTSVKIFDQWKKHNCQPNFRQNVTPDPDKSCGPYKPNMSYYVDYVKHILQAKHSNRYSKNIDGENHDTIGMVVIDTEGNVSSGTTTNGAGHKVPGRVGDSPIVGAGSYAENGKGGAAATGDGDVMMRFLPSYQTVQWMGEGYTPTQAAGMAIKRIAKFYPENYSAVVAVNSTGHHGAACHNFVPFVYTVIDDSDGQAKEININCTHS